VLKLTLPGYNGSGLILYRGECRFLYEENKIGFCWTPDALVAERFASVLNCDESGGVLLRAFVKPNSILAAPNAHSAAFMEEFEYTCNPESIHGIELIKEFYKPSI
jgi:hypothetical protein